MYFLNVLCFDSNPILLDTYLLATYTIYFSHILIIRFLSQETETARFSSPWNRSEKTAARNIQSINIPYHTPITPKWNIRTKRYANAIRNTHMENTETAIVNFASREALSEYGMVNARGQTTMAIL